MTVIVKKHALNVVDRGPKGEWGECALWILRDRMEHLWISRATRVTSSEIGSIRAYEISYLSTCLQVTSRAIFASAVFRGGHKFQVLSR